MFAFVKFVSHTAVRQALSPAVENQTQSSSKHLCCDGHVAMATPPKHPAAAFILSQLKQEVAELKASYKLASQPSSSSAPSLQGLEREAQLARKQYDGLLEQRRKQAAELEKIYATWQQLQLDAAGRRGYNFPMLQNR
jgi:hypothetical protein